MSPEITVVVPHLRQWDQLDICLASLHRQTLAPGRFAVIVVDNGSPDFDEKRPRLAERWPGVIFASEATPGPGPARNKGIALAQTPLTACIDADCIADEHWLEAALNALTRSGPGTVHGGDVRIAMKDPAVPSPVEAYEAVFGFRQQLYIEKKHFSVTANIAFWKRDFEAVGPFAGITLAEDLDWGHRCRDNGLKLAFEPRMIVLHPARNDMRALKSKWTRHIAHDLAAARSRNALAAWPFKALAVALSMLPHLALVWRSDRLSSARARAKASVVLMHIRLFRAFEMLRQMMADGSEAHRWNR